MGRRSGQSPRSGGEPAPEGGTRGWGSLLSRAGKRAGLLRDGVQEGRRSPALQHALAARERGNLEAAFWLLAEEFNQRPNDAEVNRVYWDAAVELQRVDLAAPAGVELIQRHAAAGQVELAAQYWLELVSAAPDAFITPIAIASILPELRRLLDSAPDDQRMELQGFLRRAMRHAVDPRNKGLRPGVALRLFEDGRDLNPEAARRAAEVALDSPDLHETKRDRLRTWLSGDDPDSSGPAASRTPGTRPGPKAALASRPAGAIGPTASANSKTDGLSEDEIAKAAARLPTPQVQPDDTPEEGSAADAGEPDERQELEPPGPLVGLVDLKRTDAVPVALGADHLELRTGDDTCTRIAYPEIEAICVVEVGGLADQPVAVIDLLLNWSRQGVEPLRVVRMRADSFDGAKLVPGECVVGGELASFLGELLLRSRAVPLPDPESALGFQLARFESLDDYENEILRGALAEETTGSGI